MNNDLSEEFNRKIKHMLYEFVERNQVSISLAQTTADFVQIVDKWVDNYLNYRK